MSTYKELCSLASDLNKPEMIYQFTQLASQNASSSSILVAAFDLKSPSTVANDQMKPLIEKIVPRLFRYKYHPTPRFQNSMISIWDSLVSDTKASVELHYWAILDELLTNLTNFDDNVRIACCLALRDLIKSNSGLRLRYHDRQMHAVKGDVSGGADCKMDVDPVEGTSSSYTKMDIDSGGNAETQLEPELHKLWTQLFRVMDDQKEQPRMVAEATAKQISKVFYLKKFQMYKKKMP